MILNGEIEIKGPGLIKKLTQEGEAIFSEASEELIFKTSNSEKEGVDFDIWIDLEDEGEISITTCVNDESTTVDEHFYFNIKNQGGHEIGLSMSLSQVRALSEILQSYIAAYDLLQQCRGRDIKAESA